MRRLTYYNITWGGGSHTESILFEFIIVPVLRKWIGKVSSIYSKSKRVNNWGRRRIIHACEESPTRLWDIFKLLLLSIGLRSHRPRIFIQDRRWQTEYRCTRPSDDAEMNASSKAMRVWKGEWYYGCYSSVVRARDTMVNPHLRRRVVKISLQQLTRYNTI